MSAEISTEAVPEQSPQQSLSTAAARNLATTTKTVPQMQGITSRWLLRVLPWVEVSGGTYRVNRRLTYAVGGGRVAVSQTADQAAVVPPSLREIPLFAGFADEAVLGSLAAAFDQRQVAAGEVIAERGQPADGLYVVAHGKVNRTRAGAFGADAALGVVADGGYFGAGELTGEATWDHTAVALTDTTLLVLSRTRFDAILGQSQALQARVSDFHDAARLPQNRKGEKDITITSGHDGEPVLPATFADYELNPREYELSVAQTVLRVHTRVADLFNEPMNQLKEQLRLTVEALRERQEYEMVNNPDYGLLHNAVYSQRMHTHSGPPTPDDMDELLSRRRSTKAFIAHPRAIAAFGRECSRRGLYPHSTEVLGGNIPAWRGVPIFPCNKIPVTSEHTTSIIAMRTGEDDQGVVGLRQTGIPDEYEPGMNVRFMGIDDQALMSYLVTAYFSVAVLVPDALGILENVEIAQPFS
ncbi:MAG: cyclic nucleotide-binding domain-containing protein [Streptosporangiaceae bacterium]|nr:cyclic nucleotide-binding domain-containing protein [Streptosporangiaceae bacterium]